MNRYYNEFIKYVRLSEKTKEGYTFDRLLREAKELMVSNDNRDKHAIIVLGFSGNGKTTYINNFIESNPEYSIVSMDRVAREVLDSKCNNPSAKIVENFGNALEEASNNKKNIIIDGNFLNMLTRLALIDTLSSYGYLIDMVDLTPHINETKESRIKDVSCRRLNITEDIFTNNRNHPRIKEIEKEIESFYENERARSFIDEQIDNNALSLGINKIYGREDTIILPNNGVSY